jgi:hypothetical protein
MSRFIYDEEEYEHGSKWFARWHRDQSDHNAKMIDLDSLGYCPRCLDAIYMIEATRGSSRKNASVTEHNGRRLGATVWVVYQDKTGAHPGEIFVDDRTNGVNHYWLPEAIVWKMLQALRESHQCEDAHGP